jgi:two-component system, LytTR family, sensor kinase
VISLSNASPMLAAPSTATTGRDHEGMGATGRHRALQWAVVDVVFWAALTFLFAGQYWVFSGLNGHRVPFTATLLDQLGMWVPCAVLAPLVALLTVRVRFGEGRRLRATAAHVCAAVAFAVLGGAAMGVLDWLTPGQAGPTPLAGAVGRGIVGGFTGYLLVYALIVAAVQALAYGRESRERQVAAARLQSQLADARVHALTTQLQPHFLFNTLNAVSALVRSNPAQAERTIGRLSDLLRYTLASVTDAWSTVRDEARFLGKYVEIQQARFGDRLGVNLDIDPDAEDGLVPRLLLQPLVENAIRHGIAPRAAAGHIDVRVWRDADHLRMVVRDDGAGLLPSGIREGIGLTATRARLREAYSDGYEFTLSARDGGGAIAVVTVPYRSASVRLVGGDRRANETVAAAAMAYRETQPV